jgi:hypothetical protein
MYYDVSIHRDLICCGSKPHFFFFLYLIPVDSQMLKEHAHALEREREQPTFMISRE